MDRTYEDGIAREKLREFAAVVASRDYSMEIYDRGGAFFHRATSPEPVELTDSLVRWIVSTEAEYAAFPAEWRLIDGQGKVILDGPLLCGSVCTGQTVDFHIRVELRLPVHVGVNRRR